MHRSFSTLSQDNLQQAIECIGCGDDTVETNREGWLAAYQCVVPDLRRGFPKIPPFSDCFTMGFGEIVWKADLG